MAADCAAPRRPVLRWHGGKWLLAPWIIENLPRHRVYVEPFGGAASVLVRKPRSYSEVYNDLDAEVVNLFRVLQAPEKGAELVRLLTLTPFAREEFDLSYERTDDPVERARRLVIRAFMGFGSNGHNMASRTGFRANSNRAGSTPATDWTNYPESLAQVITRFRGVTIESRPAMEVMEAHDGPETLHYVDPPYLPETRNPGHDYSHEMDEADHLALLEFLLGLKGMVVLSGYPAPLYDGLLAGWERKTKTALADGARKRTECLWINPAACAALGGRLL